MRSPHDQRSDAKDDVLPKHRLPNSWLRHHPSAGGSNGGGPPDIDRNSAGTRMLATQTVFSLIDAWLRLSMLDDGRGKHRLGSRDRNLEAILPVKR